jgi:uncharacterized protein
MEINTLYFETEGELNTDNALAAALKRAKELNIKTVLVASTRGFTGVKAVEVFKGLNVIIVSHSFGMQEPNTTRFLPDNRKIIEAKGGKILTTTHAFGGIHGAFQEIPKPPPPDKPLTAPPPQLLIRPPTPGNIIAQTLLCISRGMKVAAEISIMAADAGLVRTDEDIIAIGGTSRGADTAVVLKPTNANRVFELRVKEIICKPR